MATLAMAALSAFTLVGAVVLFQLDRRRIRRRRLEGLELRPDCLLTRYPIAFLSGPRSLFWLFDHWNDVPTYLREHGFDVIVIEPADNGAKNSVLEALGELSGLHHLIADSSQRVLLESLARAKHEKVASLTLITSRHEPESDVGRLSPEALRPFDVAIESFEIRDVPLALDWRERLAMFLLRLHGLAIGGGRRIRALETGAVKGRTVWAIENRFLDLAISLAERDLQC